MCSAHGSMVLHAKHKQLPSIDVKEQLFQFEIKWEAQFVHELSFAYINNMLCT